MLAVGSVPVNPYVASESFLTSALLGIMPLTEVNGLPIGGGTPGPISLNLGAALERSMARPSR
jgi:hypothetical protein